MSDAPAIVHTPREQWLLRRKSMITASDVPAILGADEHRSPFFVWASKTGDLEQQETLLMRRGRRYEEAIAQDFAEQTGRPVENLGAYEIQQHPSLPWLGATLDRITVLMGGSFDGPAPSLAPAAGPGPLQIKLNIGSPHDWRESPPLGYIVQVQIEIACYGSSWGTLTALTGPGPLAVFDLERDESFLKAAIPALEKFRWNMARGIAPEVDGSPSTSDAIKRLWADENGQTVDLDAAAMTLADEWEQAKVFAERAEKKVDLLANQIKARLENATFGRLPDHSAMTLKTVHRNGYTVGPVKYRQLRRWRPKLNRRRK